MSFLCNVCGAECNPAEKLAREQASCTNCKSSVRLRALIALLSQEIFGTLLALPEFPAIKGIRGIGMSDTPQVAERLAEKFDYTNTFYHQSPRFDLTHPDPRDFGRYDFILSSEVMEHVPPPVEPAFANLHALLKPNGLLLLTTPYNIGGQTEEHFPQLHEFTLTRLGGKTVLVNRRRDGSIETFENLIFHGGHGSTLEMRAFTESSLRAVLRDAGFDEVHFEAENRPEYGIDHAESWSLPIAARTGTFQPPAAELALEYREACRLAARKIRDLEAITAEYERHIAHHKLAHEQWVSETTQRVAWIRKVEADWQERTKWALESEQARKQAVEDFYRVEASEKEAWGAVETLSRKLKDAQAELARLNSAAWVRLGRRLRMFD
ncbi:MAG TPA: methyltransferase domain-containing protein [Bryobacteraceae bacterium]|nr:methyltransferase domain-containing protein [Bryobacteraceae bacterium]